MMKLLFASALLSLAACVPVYDYEGRYDMTYDVILSPVGADEVDVRAGITRVEVRPGPNQEFLIDLGPDFCQLQGTEVMVANEPAYLDIRPQDCWFLAGATTYTMELTGSATLASDERLLVVLSGSYLDEIKRVRGTATVELTESW